MIIPASDRPHRRRLGLGRLWYRLWHVPVGRIRRSIAEGGPVEQWRTARGHDEMRAAAHDLRLPPFPNAQPLAVHLLTGKRFWDQTAFCLYSFAVTSARPVAATLYDDGTLDEPLADYFRDRFPGTKIVAQHDTLSRLDAHLPASRFPYLRDRWLHYPNIRKLLDVHVGATGWKLVIDSDLLFFRRPTFLVDWLAEPRRPLHAVDAESSYGYSRPLLDAIASAPVADLVNVGLTGLCSDAIDWDQLEHLCARLIEAEGTHYYLEQALIALLVAGRDCAIAPAADYVTLPRLPEATACQAVMHHYVADSKRWYFRTNWRRVRNDGGPRRP